VDPSADIKIVAFVAERDFTYLVGDATNAFPKSARVKRYRRHLWVGDNRVVVFDDLELQETKSRYWNNVQWTLYSDPRSHRVTAHGTQLLWHAPEMDAPRLRVNVLEPDGFAWERARLDSVDEVSMLVAHRLVRPEWYTDRIQVLAELITDVGQTPSQIVRHKQLLAVKPADTSDSAIAFALAPLKNAGQVIDELHELRHQDLCIFGQDPTRPGTFVRLPKRNK